MKITAQQYISNDRDKNTYVSVFKYDANKTDKHAYKEGDLYGIVHLSGSEGIPAERVVKFVWDGIVDGYIYSNSDSTNESLKSAIKEGLRKIKDLIRNDKELEQSGVNISFTVIAHKREGFYVANFGENDIFVYRDNKLIDIVEVLAKNKAETAGLALKENEVIMISTPTLLKDGISNFMGLTKLDEFRGTVRNFATNLTSSEGLLILYVSKEEQKLKAKNILKKGSDNEEIKVNVKPLINTELLKRRENPSVKKKVLRNKDSLVKEIGKKSVDIDFKGFLEKVKSFFAKVLDKVNPIWDKVRGFFKKIFGGLFEKIKEKLGKKRWFKKLSADFSQKMPKMNRKRRVSAKGFKIDGYREKDLRSKRFKIVGIVVLIVVLLSFGINFTLRSKKAREVHSAANVLLTESETLIGKVESNISTNKNSAETYIYQIGQKLESLPEGMNEEDTDRAADVRNKALALEDTLYKRIGVQGDDGSISTFVNARLSFGDGSVPTDIDIYQDDKGNEYLLVSDSGNKGVYRVSLYDKDVKKLPDNDGSLSSPQYLSMGNTGVFVFDEDEGVLKAPFADDYFGSFTALSGLDIGAIRGEDISEFIVLTAADNVYLLSQEKSSILKSGFSYGNSYNLTYSYIDNPAFAEGKDIVADLSLYVLDGSIIRYVYDYIQQGQVEAKLSVAGYSGDLGSLDKGYTRQDMNYSLYLFDSVERRIFRFEKPLEGGGEVLHPDQVLLESQYVYRGTKEGVWSDVKDLVVDSSEANMYVLDGSTIWKVKL